MRDVEVDVMYVAVLTTAVLTVLVMLLGVVITITQVPPFQGGTRDVLGK